MKFFLHTSQAPEPIGPYSQGILAQGSLIFLSGQIPLDTNGELIGSKVGDQTRQVIRNIEALLTAAESSLGDVVKATVFLKNMDDFAEMNAVYQEYFGESKPARSTVEVARLPKDVLVEIEVIAVRP